MTTLAFPDTAGKPTDGSFTYEANGVIYSWTGDYWAANNAQGFDHRYVNVDGDQMTGDLTVPSLNGGPLAGFRNQIINGNMYFHQRQPTDAAITSSTSGYHSVDRFAFNSNSTTRCTNDASLQAFGFYKVLEASRSSGNINIAQMIELPMNIGGNQGREGPFVNGSTWTLTFWANTQPALAQISFAAAATGTGGADVSLASEVGANLETVGDAVGGFTRYKLTHTITAGSDRATARGVKILIAFPSSGTAIRTTGWQYELGPVATPFEHRPIGTELALCQRYYQKVFMQGLIGNYNSSGSFAFFNVSCVPMRLSEPSSDSSNIQISTGRLLTSGGTSVPIASIGFFSRSSGRIGIARKESTNTFSAVTCCTADLGLDAEL